MKKAQEFLAQQQAAETQKKRELEEKSTRSPIKKANKSSVNNVKALLIKNFGNAPLSKPISLIPKTEQAPQNLSEEERVPTPPPRPNDDNGKTPPLPPRPDENAAVTATNSSPNSLVKNAPQTNEIVPVAKITTDPEFDIASFFTPTSRSTNNTREVNFVDFYKNQDKKSAKTPTPFPNKKRKRDEGKFFATNYLQLSPEKPDPTAPTPMTPLGSSKK